MSTSKILTKDQILSANDHRTIEVGVPEWGGTVRLRTMSGKERDSFEFAVATHKAPDGTVDIRGLKALLVAMCAVGEDGQLLFTKADVEALNQKSSEALEKVYTKAAYLCGIGEDTIKETEGNSDKGPSA